MPTARLCGKPLRPIRGSLWELVVVDDTGARVAEVFESEAAAKRELKSHAAAGVEAFIRKR